MQKEVSMTIHVVKSGETITTIADQYQIDVDRLIIDNGLTHPDQLAIGQTIVIIHPLETYTIQEGDTLLGIAQKHEISYQQLLRNNPYLSDREYIYPGETVVIRYETDISQSVEFSGYAYPFISKDILRKTLPYLTYLTVFNYRITAEGELVDIDDEEIVRMALAYEVIPVMMVSTVSELGVGSFEVSSIVLNNEELQDKLIENIVRTAKTKGYYGVNHTLQYFRVANKSQMENYIKRLSERLRAEGLSLYVTISPRLNIDRTEVFYDGVDFSTIAQYVNGILILSYDWAFSLGPPSSATPFNITEQVLTTLAPIISGEKVSLGFSVIGYDWALPYIPGDTIANSITTDGAVSLAYETGANIQYNEVAQAPFFFYTIDQQLHNVWFVDARTVEALTELIPKYKFARISIWNIMTFFTQMWFILNNSVEIVKKLKS